jgi:hypothetical protein
MIFSRENDSIESINRISHNSNGLISLAVNDMKI